MSNFFTCVHQQKKAFNSSVNIDSFKFAISEKWNIDGKQKLNGKNCLAF